MIWPFGVIPNASWKEPLTWMTNKMAGNDSSDAKRLLRERIPKHIRELHLRAGNDACYWVALCQSEQNRTDAAIAQCRNYLDRYRSGLWTGAAKSLLAVSLA